MEQHAIDLLHAAVWLIGFIGAGALGTAIWGGKKVLYRLDRIEELLGSETKLLRESLHAHDVRLVRLEEFKDRMENHTQWGRRFSDHDTNGNVG
jgi:hypothetical protein